MAAHDEDMADVREAGGEEEEQMSTHEKIEVEERNATDYVLLLEAAGTAWKRMLTSAAVTHAALRAARGVGRQIGSSGAAKERLARRRASESVAGAGADGHALQVLQRVLRDRDGAERHAVRDVHQLRDRHVGAAA